jgi:hypothetical protein
MATQEIEDRLRQTLAERSNPAQETDKAKYLISDEDREAALRSLLLGDPLEEGQLEDILSTTDAELIQMAPLIGF